MKAARYDDELLPKVMSFAVEDVFVSAIFSVACSVLAEIGEDYKRPHADVRDLYCVGRAVPRRRRRDHRRTNRRGKGFRRPRGEVGRHRDRRAVRAAAVRRTAARQGTRAAATAGGPAVLRPSGPEVRADPVDVAGVAGLPAARVLARSGVAGDDVAVLLGFARRGWAERSLDAAAGRACGRPATAPSPSTTNRSPVNRWAACSSRGPPRRCWTGWAEPSRSRSARPAGSAGRVLRAASRGPRG